MEHLVLKFKDKTLVMVEYFRYLSSWIDCKVERHFDQNRTGTQRIYLLYWVKEVHR